MRPALASFLGAILLVTALGCDRAPESGAAGSGASNAPTASTGGADATAPIIEASADADSPNRVLDPRSDQLLRSMSTLLASTKAFAFEAEERFDEIPTGQPRALLSNARRVAVQRPNRFAADAEGDTLSRSVWFDGENVAVYDRTQNVYARIPAAGSIDGALDTLADKYAAAVPLADLLYGDPYAVLTEDVTYSKYLGLHRAAGVLCHHLVFSQPTIEWQIWIDAGEQPLPRQMVITYVREPGEPQYTAVLTKWRLLQAIPDNLFRFEAPEGAERVDAASLVPRQPGGSE